MHQVDQAFPGFVHQGQRRPRYGVFPGLFPARRYRGRLAGEGVVPGPAGFTAGGRAGGLYPHVPARNKWGQMKLISE